MGARMVKAVLTAMALVSLGVGVASAQVPDPFARELAGRLTRAERPLVERGFGRVAGPWAGELHAGESQSFRLTLRANQRYEVMGVCDARCAGLEVHVSDAQEVLSRAHGGDGFSAPIVPRATGVYVLDVRVEDCAAEICYFAINLYAG